MNIPEFIIQASKKQVQHIQDSLCLRCLTNYRLPEPIRLADKLSKCKIVPVLI